MALLERHRCGHVDTGQTTAHLTCVTDKRLHELASDFGKESAKAVWEAGFAAIDQIAAIIRNENLKCDFKWVPGYLHASLKGDARKEREGLEKDAQLAEELGFEAQFLDSIPYFNRPGVRFPNQAKFHPIKYLSALARIDSRQRKLIFENTAAESFDEKPLTVHSGSHKIRCDYVFPGDSHTADGHDGFGFGNACSKRSCLSTPAMYWAPSYPKDFFPKRRFGIPETRTITYESIDVEVLTLPFWEAKTTRRARKATLNCPIGVLSRCCTRFSPQQK